MLSHLSSKFSAPLPEADIHERRSALFLNRYTRTLTIMHATDGLSDLLGISGDELKGKSFYYCIQENCLKDAVRCLENAKANDSIAYLRFWYRDPRQDDDQLGDTQAEARNQDSALEDAVTSDSEMEVDSNSRENSHVSIESEPVSSTDSIQAMGSTPSENHLGVPRLDSRTSSDESSNPYSHEAIFGEPENQLSSASSVSTSPSAHDRAPYRQARAQPVELEAVVSCTSDGLVVCLRQASPTAPPQPSQAPAHATAERGYANGLFAVPWATEPMLPSQQQRTQEPQRPSFAPSLAPAQAFHRPLTQPSKPPPNDFMNSIRECAVFAWALTGINGSLADYSRGTPRGESQPSSGLPVWQPENSAMSAQAKPQANPSFSRPKMPEPRPSSIATGKYFDGQDIYQPPLPQHNGYNTSSSASQQRPIGLHGGNGNMQSESNGRSTPSMPSHMVDGVVGAFTSQRDPFSPERSGSSNDSSSSSGFGFGDPGAGAQPNSKLLNSSRPPNAAPPPSGKPIADRPTRNYYDPARMF